MIDEAVYQLSKIKLNKISDYYTKEEIKQLTNKKRDDNIIDKK